MTSIGLRPALLFLSSAGVNTTPSISARKLSNGTTRSIISSGSPFAEMAVSRLSASKNPSCPIGPTSANLVVISQTRTNWLRRLFFEAPLKDIVNDALRKGLSDLNAHPKQREPSQTQVVDLGRMRLPSIDNISESLAVAEGETFK